MKDWIRKLYLPPDCLALTDAQLRVVSRHYLTPLLNQPIMVAHIAVLLACVTFFKARKQPDDVTPDA